MEKGDLGETLPALAEAARTVGSPQIRAAGSLGGNLGTCSPAGDSLPVLSATNSLVHLTSAGGTRMVPFSEFMTGPKRNSRQPHEIITAVTVPKLLDGRATPRWAREMQWSSLLPLYAWCFMTTNCALLWVQLAPQSFVAPTLKTGINRLPQKCRWCVIGNWVTCVAGITPHR